jgi:hypothetical protein
MPRYFLNIEYDDGSNLPDQDGGEYANLDAAMDDARRGLKALVCEIIDTEGERVATHIHVLDAAGMDLGVVTIGHVVPESVKKALANP